MKNKGRSVVVGAGAGGLATALFLQSHGEQVTLLDRNDVIGGKLSSYSDRGFLFDRGPSILTLPNILRLLFEESGARLEDYLTLKNLDPQWKCFFEDGTVFELRRDVDEQMEAVAKLSPTDVQGFRELRAIGEELYEIAEQNFFFRDVGGVGDILSARSFDLGALSLVQKLRPWQTYASLVRSKIKHPRLQQALEHLTQYVGSSPFECPAILGLLLHVQLAKGCWYPMGGMHQISAAIAKRFQEIGGEIVLDSEIEGVNKIGKNLSLVRDRTGREFTGENFIFNADLNTFRTQILDEQPVSEQLACSGVVIFAGVDRAVEGLAHHNFFFSKDSHIEFDEMYRLGVPPADPTIYLCAPSKTDDAVAPPGKENLFFLIHVPALNGKTDWKTFLPKYKEMIYRKCERLLGDRFTSDLIIEVPMSPEHIQSRYNTYQGNIYGFASHGKMRGGFKPKNKYPGFDNVWLAGGTANPGAGVPMSLMSGLIAGASITGDLERLRLQRI